MAGGIFGKLSDKAVKAFVAKAAPGKKLSDGGGLYLFVPPAGSANWRIKYRIEGKEKVFSVGPFPLVSLAAARVALGEVKAVLLENKDPVTERRVNRAAAAAGSPAWIAPTTIPGGKPVTAVPGLTPRSPVTVVMPAFNEAEILESSVADVVDSMRIAEVLLEMDRLEEAHEALLVNLAARRAAVPTMPDGSANTRTTSTTPSRSCQYSVLATA